MYKRQQRVRGKITLPDFYDNMNLLTQYPHVFLSQEALKMYGAHYLNSVEKQLGLTPSIITTQHKDIFIDDANNKYIKTIQEQPLDRITQKASSKWK